MRLIKWLCFLLVAFYVCAFITIYPLPTPWQWARPQWLLMLVTFCAVTQPVFFNVWVAWGLGLLLDMLLALPLGQNGLIFAIISYLITYFRPKFLSGSLAWQLGKMFIICLFSQAMILWFHALQGQKVYTWFYWSSVGTSVLVWPLFVYFHQGLSRLFGLKPLKRGRIRV